jgi:hypothetical protein
MSAGVLAPIKTQPTGPVPKLGRGIDVSVSVRADRQRLLQVLTVAEYMEAWLSIPGLSSDSHLAITSTSDHFRIDHFRSRRLDFMITGLYRTWRRSKLQFTWRKESETGSSTSYVLLRLCGDFGRTNLALTHTGLGSNADHIWHQVFWERSLGRLRSLF